MTDLSQTQEDQDKFRGLHSSFLELFMDKYYSKLLLSTYGIISVLVMYFILICVGAYGVTLLDIDFRQSYFISDDAYIKQYITRQEQYFKRGDLIEVFTELEGIDIFSDIESFQQ